jgi:hypothetical protein
MKIRIIGLILVALGARAGMVGAQDVASPKLRAALQEKAGRYPLRDVRVFGRDSALLVFEDSSYSSTAVQRGSWTFGPPVTAAEADRCPPEKVLGRKIARVFWRTAGIELGIQQVVIRVHGAGALEQWNFSDMYYYRDQLEGAWAGDPIR